MYENIFQEQKEELRIKMKKLRDGINEASRAAQNKTLTEMILQTALYADAKYILSYVSFGSEVSTTELLKKAMKDGKAVYVPRISDGAMEFYQLEDFSSLKKNAMGIPEPDGNPAKLFPYDMHISLDRAEECIMLVPGLAFDKKLNRCGYGGGYYDRYLKNFHKKMAIGLSYSEQIIDKVPVTDKDVPLDLVVTPTGAYF